MSSIKSALFGGYRRVVNLLWGTGLSNIPFIYWVYCRIFRLLRPSNDMMEINGYKMLVGMEGFPEIFVRSIQAYIIKSGWEPETTRLFNQLVKKDDVVVDVGANMGYFTLLSAGLGAKVYAFEPNPLNYKLLTKNVEINGFNNNVIAEQKAVSDKNEKMQLYLSSRDIGSHTIYKSDKPQPSVEVESVTLDEYFKGKEHPIDIVKLDIEGAEPFALRGMSNIIKQNEYIKIFIEFFPNWIIRAGLVPEQFLSQLLSQFSITAIEDYAVKHTQYSKVSTIGEIMDICKNENVVNLLLEKKS